MDNFKFKKSLGQNFIKDDNIIDKIVKYSEVDKDTLVIEIGPGLGSLTAKLLEKAKKVIAIELDEKLADFLEKRFALYENFELQLKQDLFSNHLQVYSCQMNHDI